MQAEGAGLRVGAGPAEVEEDRREQGHQGTDGTEELHPAGPCGGLRCRCRFWLWARDWFRVRYRFRLWFRRGGGRPRGTTRAPEAGCQ
ncbi:hypothetical protein GCM10010252_55780 [Streptomyces aureoverticillatus]|nr:hypothetical protein GCM10010252_55780 [Streptomyces aureoverticillatus]